MADRTGLHRRTLLQASFAAPLAAPAFAQGWPSRPVRLVVPFPPGGPPDVLGRAMSESLSARWGQPVVIENRPGAGGNLGAEMVARAAPDGHTLLIAASSHVQGAALFRNLPFHPVRDFTAVSLMAYYALVAVVHPSVPVNTLADFIALARQKPGEVTYASTGVGTPTHLAVELFRLRAGLTLTHVPYPGASPAHAALLSGQVMAMFNNPVLSIPSLRGGALRGLAVTGAARTPQLPDLPTVAESGFPGFEATTWFGILGPAGMPGAIAERVHADVRDLLAGEAMQNRLAAMGMQSLGEGPDPFARRMAEEATRWAQVIQDAGIRME